MASWMIIIEKVVSFGALPFIKAQTLSAVWFYMGGNHPGPVQPPCPLKSLIDTRPDLGYNVSAYIMGGTLVSLPPFSLLDYLFLKGWSHEGYRDWGRLDLHP